MSKQDLIDRIERRMLKGWRTVKFEGAELDVILSALRPSPPSSSSPPSANPKMKPCPRCGSADVSVYSYDSGWKYVECVGADCWYRGPGEGSIRQAIKSHNAKAIEITALKARQSSPESQPPQPIETEKR